VNERIYVDTSTIAKWYLNEPSSDMVERFLQEHGPVEISELTVVEMRSLLARRRREGSIDASLEMEIFAAFSEDIRQGFLICRPLPAEWATAAVHLFSVLHKVRIRALDAIHLAIATDLPANILVSSDRVMVEGARTLGLAVVEF
jgi:uncharacterized protein